MAKAKISRKDKLMAQLFKWIEKPAKKQKTRADVEKLLIKLEYKISPSIVSQYYELYTFGCKAYTAGTASNLVQSEEALAA